MNHRYEFKEEHFPAELITGVLTAFNPICLDILYKRGIRDAEAAKKFLSPGLDEILGAETLLDVDKAIDVLREAIEQDKEIVIYQDYDADGCCACAIAVECLTKLGARVSYYCNDRTIDGFGMCKSGVDNILGLHPNVAVIMTVDNGIVANEAVDYAMSKGIKVIITDHHEQGDVLPSANAVVNPKRRDETYSYRDFCGAGVIWKVMLALYRNLDRKIAPVLNTTDIVALATVADVVPLTGENRALVRNGMRLIHDGVRPAFAALGRIMQPKVISAHHTLAYVYAPMINSLSRMGEDTSLAVQLLLSTDGDVAGQVALKLKETNDLRKEQTEEQTQIAMNAIDPDNLPPAIVVYDPAFSEGMVGIIAGKLKETYGVPAVVFADSLDGELKGSCRSTDAVNIKEVLDGIAEHILRYGGHPKAAGLSIAKDRLLEFTKALCDAVLPFSADIEEEQVLTVDAELDESEVTPKLISALRILEPYGEGNPEPRFSVAVHCTNVRYMGSDSQHVKLTGESGLSAIKWNGADEFRAAAELPHVVTGHLSLNEWQGRVTPQLIMD